MVLNLIDWSFNTKKTLYLVSSSSANKCTWRHKDVVYIFNIFINGFHLNLYVFKLVSLTLTNSLYKRLLLNHRVLCFRVTAMSCAFFSSFYAKIVEDFRKQKLVLLYLPSCLANTRFNVILKWNARFMKNKQIWHFNFVQ